MSKIVVLLRFVHGIFMAYSWHLHGEVTAKSFAASPGRSVPKVIYDALREAGALVETHVENLEAHRRIPGKTIGGVSIVMVNS